MKKYLSVIILMFVLCSCGPVYAVDIELTILIREGNVTTILDAFDSLSDQKIKIASKDLGGSIYFEYQGKQKEESLAVFGKRVVRSLIKAMLQLKAKADDAVRDSIAMSTARLPPTIISDNMTE